jgi:hypothetical protein
MHHHTNIDRRSLALARAVASRIDADPQHSGLLKARAVCRRWLDQGSSPAVREWAVILEHPWEQVREILLAESEGSRRLRQSGPFVGILSPRERWTIYRKFKEHETTGP